MKTNINYNSIQQFCLKAGIALISILLSTIYVNAQNTSGSKTNMSMDKFLKQAIYHGLEKNALSSKLVHDLLNDNGLWVGKCPICDGVRRGFRMYTKENKPKRTEKLNEKILKGLKDKSLEKRKTGLKLLVDHYVQQYYVSLKMSEKERKVMEEKLKEGRKTGMDRANKGEGFYCSSCDGACHISDSKD